MKISLLVCLLIALFGLVSAGSTNELKNLPGYGKVSGQYTGYLVANSTLDTQLFYWLIEAPVNSSELPLLVWLQGGPGCSSMLGLFQENGPFYVLQNLTLINNENSWNTIANVLYIDQPVGTGFSDAGKSDQYVHTEEEAANNLYAALVDFLSIFPQYSGRDTYISGESYAGKYIPWLGNKILSTQGGSNEPLNVVGLSIGDGWTSPLEQAQKYAEQAYSFGLIDHKQRTDVEARMDICRTTYLIQEWDITTTVCNDVLDSIQKYSGGINVEYVIGFNSSFNPYISDYLNQDSVKRALGVPELHKFRICSDEVSFRLRADNYKPSVQFLPEELANYKVLLYSGQLDLICGSIGTEAYLETLDWSGKDEFNKADKTIWMSRFTSTPAGYVTQAENLTYIMVNDAGHMVPFYQPQNALDMMNRFINNLPF